MNEEQIEEEILKGESKSLIGKVLALTLIGIVYFALFIFIFQTEVIYMYIIIILNYIFICLNFFTNNEKIKIVSIIVFILFIILSVYYYVFSTKVEAKYVLNTRKNISYNNMVIEKKTNYMNIIFVKINRNLKISNRSLTIYDNKNNMEYKVYYDTTEKDWKIKDVTKLEYKIENYLKKKYNESFKTIKKKKEHYETKCENFDGCWPVRDKKNYYKIYTVKANKNNIEFEVKYTCINGKGSFTDNYEETIKQINNN